MEVENQRVPVAQAAKELGMAQCEVRYLMRMGELNIGSVDQPKQGGQKCRYRVYRRLLDKELGLNG